MNEQNKSLKRLVQILDTCGANPARWPQDERAAMQSFIGTNAAAKALQQEAIALENALDAASPIGGVEALQSRILSAAMMPQAPRMSAQLIAFPEKPAGPENSTGRWGVAALLAASLVFGVWVGASGFAEGIVTLPLEAAGLDTGDQFSSFYVSGIGAAEELL